MKFLQKLTIVVFLIGFLSTAHALVLTHEVDIPGGSVVEVLIDGEYGYIATFDGYVYKFPLADPSLVEKLYPISGTPLGNIYGKPAIYGNYLLIPYASYKIIAIDKNTGAFKVVYPESIIDVRTDLVIDDNSDILYFGDEVGVFHAIRLEFNAQLQLQFVPVWNFPTGQTIRTPAYVDNGIVYFGNSAGNLYAKDQFSGAEIWTQSIAPDDIARGVIGDLFINDNIFVTSQAGRLHKLNKANGADIWNYPALNKDPLPGLVTAGPARSGNVFGFGTNKTTFWGIEDGATEPGTAWVYDDYQGEARIPSKATVDRRERFVFGSEDGCVYQVNNQGGLVDRYCSGYPITASPIINGSLIYVVTKADDTGKLLVFTDGAGDINGDNQITLADAIIALQIISGLNPGGIDLEADVNGDNKIGLPEVIYVLQIIGGLR
ncbi:hypothetical protein COV49_01560 [Candidatus Falkowbacteria bacterium CG11_big_fil_rev_8_21_14_0_20_39_10]|uniref:Pyrrolo-quinoline quinone repeat domain-containing protein n=1 Tax=Candidatus Falkowbacteria bacterium CG11_big_fil_rev_8_21_14_0_20_39_10 TaxID=1974570 RepID=A0A2M6K9H7_9BACT|nr:MAG: hypothetical protein COV49_01560 [Candidatus Falkowbacteria bacterium CG11_big_fil_rev_8_21_14_0_20_39_10]